MKIALFAGLMLGATLIPGAASAQQSTINQTIAGTRLDLTATGEVTRVPNIAVVSTGVVTRASTAGSAIQQAAARMSRVRAALKSAGIEDRDLQTSNLSLNPEYRYDNNEQKLVGYSASNTLSVRFRDIANTGRIIDALVAEGSNQINGPTLTIDKPEAALDEARARAIANGRARAELYARSLGMRVVRVVTVSESGGSYPIPPATPVMMMAERSQASSKVDAGEQKIQVNLTMTFELQ